MITEEQYNTLKDAEEYFRTITIAQFKRVSPKNLDETILNTLDEITGTKHNRNLNCNVCLYNLYKEAAKYYFDYEDYITAGGTTENNNNFRPSRRGRKKSTSATTTETA